MDYYPNPELDPNPVPEVGPDMETKPPEVPDTT
jgi:hypothetical protein